MSSDQLERLFQDGVQFNANELQAGGRSGLGLYIAKGIAMQHSVRLQATSDGLGQGTTFEMILSPRKITSDGNDEDYDVEEYLPFDQRSGTGTAVASSNFKQAKTKLKVLVVDDVKSNRKLLCRLLENKGHECHEAGDGQHAMEVIALAEERAEPPFDSILLDYEMPRMDGPTTAKEIRCTLMDHDTIIVGITGNVLPEDFKYFESCGANGVLCKPIKVAELIGIWERQGILENNSEQKIVDSWSRP